MVDGGCGAENSAGRAARRTQWTPFVDGPNNAVAKITTLGGIVGTTTNTLTRAIEIMVRSTVVPLLLAPYRLSPYILHEVRQTRDDVSLMLLFANAGVSLYDYIFDTHAHHPVVYEQNIPRIVAMAVHSLRRMHELGVVHRDIKLENIIVRTNDAGDVVDLQFIDNEFSGVYANRTGFHEPVGTPIYAAPELHATSLRADDIFSPDVFSLGVVLHILVHGEHPFATRSTTEEDVVPNMCANRRHYVTNPRFFSLDRTISRMLMPTGRPTADAVCGDQIVQLYTHIAQRAADIDHSKWNAIFDDEPHTNISSEFIEHYDLLFAQVRSMSLPYRGSEFHNRCVSAPRLYFDPIPDHNTP